MALSNLPTAEEIRLESGIIRSQVNPALADDAAYEADISARISEQAALVEQRLAVKALPYGWPFTSSVLESAFPLYTSEQRTEAATRSQANAGKVVELWTIADLYTSAHAVGRTGNDYLEKATYFQERGEGILKVVEAEVSRTSGQATAGSSNSQFSGTLTTNPSYLGG